MIEPPQSAEQPIRRGNQLPGFEPHGGLNGAARHNRAAQLASDIQQILSFADREFNRQARAATEVETVIPAPMAQRPEVPPPPPESAVESVSVAPTLESMRREPAQAQRNLSMPAQHIHLPNTGGWQNRFRDQGARVVSLVLCAMIAIEVARAAMTLFGGSAVTGPQAIAPQASLAQAAVPTNMRALQRPVVDVHKIIAAQLFGSFAADPSTQDPSGAPRTAANLQLAGTLATENPKAGFAIISDTGPAEVYTVGASVGGATLYSVYRDHVILNRNGILETLLLPKLSLGKGRGSTPAVASRSAESGEPKPLDASNARTVADAVRTAASVGPDGRLRGFRLFPNGNREAFDKSGLRGGDLLVAVNGASLQNQDRRTGSEILSSFTTSGSVSVTVERNGERQELTLNAPVESIE